MMRLQIPLQMQLPQIQALQSNSQSQDQTRIDIDLKKLVPLDCLCRYVCNKPDLRIRMLFDSSRRRQLQLTANTQLSH